MALVWVLRDDVIASLPIACAKVANLMTAQAAARAREMALRVSIGAGRARLVQLVLVESACLALLSAALGACLAWWSAPFVVSRINPPDNPARLNLPADWRVLAFGVALTLALTLLFGLAPALRASKMNPASVLRGGAYGPPTRRRLMHLLIAVQVAFSFLVLFGAGLFAVTFDHLSHFPLGFSADRVLTLESIAQHDQPTVFWDQTAAHLRSMPGVEAAALAMWPLLTGWNGFVSVNGAPPGPLPADFMAVSPGRFDTMKMPILQGRDFRPADAMPGAVIVNQTFVRQFLNGANPLGVSIAKGTLPFQVVGVVRDTPYHDLRQAILPVVFVPFHSEPPTRYATLVVRTASANPLELASILRHEVTRARISNLRTQTQLVQAQTVRERLLAMLALFFAAVVLVLAGIGLYGVLDYSVLAAASRNRHSHGSWGAGRRYCPPRHRGRRRHGPGRRAGRGRTGHALGALHRHFALPGEAHRPGDAAIILAATLAAALPAVFHAVRIDPVAMLRAE